MQLLFLIISITAILQAEGARIVSVSLVSTKSHKNVYEPLLLEMAKKGHEITIITPIPSGKNKTNVREVVIPGYQELMDSQINFFELKEKNIKMNPFTGAVSLFSEACELGYKEQAVKDLLKEKFDLVLVSVLFNECAYGLVRKFNAPTIAVSSISTPFWLSGAIGNPSPPSFVPNGFMIHSDRMSFIERTLNLGMLGFIAAVQNFYYFPVMEDIYRRHLDPSLPSAMEIFREDVSLILSNSHFSLNSLRPLMPQIVEVGGMHCRPAKPLPKDLDDFLKDTDKEGFIYFSMGSALQAHMMPERYRKIFLNTFSKLKMKVLWKWETETMPDLPKNVKLGKWLPQQDILGHPNIKLFITHGGLLSTEEAVYHGVPLVGIPMFGDQDMNMKNSESMGFAESLDFATLSEETMLDAINKILSNSEYKKKVQHLSKIFRDQPEKPLDRAVFWTEYVLRHKGAGHLRSPAAELNFFQYFSIDVVAFLAAVLFIALYIPFLIIRALCRKCCGSKNTGKKVVDAKKKKS